MSEKKRDTEIVPSVKWQSYEEILGYQITPDSLIRLTTGDGRTFELRLATSENICDPDHHADSVLKFIRKESPVGNAWKIIRMVNGEEQYVDLLSAELPILAIVDDSEKKFIGYYGNLMGGIYQGEPLSLSRSRLALDLPSIRILEGQNILPDENTPKVEALLKKHYRGQLTQVMEQKFRESKEEMEPVLSGKIELSFLERESIDILAIQTKVAYLIQQFFLEIEEKGTLSMTEEEFIEASEILKIFIAAHRGESGALQVQKAQMSLKNSQGQETLYEIDARRVIKNDRIDWFEVKKISPLTLSEKLVNRFPWMEGILKRFHRKK